MPISRALESMHAVTQSQQSQSYDGNESVLGLKIMLFLYKANKQNQSNENN